MLIPFSYINSDFKDSQLITIYRAGYTALPVISEFRIQRDATYPYCNIHYVVEGNGEVRVGGHTYPLKQGDFFILSAFIGHEYYAQATAPFVLKWMEFSGGLELVQSFLKRWNSPVLTIHNHMELLASFESILTDLSENKKDCFKQSKDVYSFLINCLALCKEPHNMTAQQRIINTVFDYMKSNIHTSLELTDLAKLAGYSESYFTKFFKEQTGQTPHQAITELRHHRSRQLLITTDLSILDIAHSINYYDTSHFIKDFKRFEGMTPLEFRQQSKLYG